VFVGSSDAYRSNNEGSVLQPLTLLKLTKHPTDASGTALRRQLFIFLFIDSSISASEMGTSYTYIINA
jgi:hypothetical protein